MKRLFLTLEDGTVFEGRGAGQTLETKGLLSFYTGVVGYQEVVTDPANAGKIILFTFPLIGNYGVNAEDSESTSPKVAGVITKECSSIYSNFRAFESLVDFLSDADVSLGTDFDTRAILLHLRENGEMMASISSEPVDAGTVAKAAPVAEYIAENRPIKCEDTGKPIRARVIDIGASKSLYRYLAANGIDATCEDSEAELVIVSDAPYYAVESDEVLENVSQAVKGKPVIGFGHGSCIVARLAGGSVKRMRFGDHGVNVPVRSIFGGRNEITSQNQNFEVVAGGDIEALFTNVHDDSCEGFRCTAKPYAGVNFLPYRPWLDLLLESVGVKKHA